MIILVYNHYSFANKKNFMLKSTTQLPFANIIAYPSIFKWKIMDWNDTGKHNFSLMSLFTTLCHLQAQVMTLFSPEC